MENWNGIASLLAACIELILIVNLLLMAEKTKVNKLAISIITLLFVYQLFEFMMCQLGLSTSFMAYLAFADISLLPPLSLYFILVFLGYPINKFSWLIFLPAVSFILYYSLVIAEFKVVSCTVLYASYNYPLGTLYGAFYYLPVLTAMLLLFLKIRKEKSGKKIFLAKILLAGYIIISLPVILAFALAATGNSILLSIVESVMCKFAVFLALCLGFLSLYDRKNPVKS